MKASSEQILQPALSLPGITLEKLWGTCMRDRCRKTPPFSFYGCRNKCKYTQTPMGLMNAKCRMVV